MKRADKATRQERFLELYAIYTHPISLYGADRTALPESHLWRRRAEPPGEKRMKKPMGRE
jgi:hypothetical protein